MAKSVQSFPISFSFPPLSATFFAAMDPEGMHLGNKKTAPIEILHANVPDEYSGKIIELVGIRRGELIDMENNNGRKNLKFHIPTRGLIGLRSKMLTASAGEAIVTHRFLKYDFFKAKCVSVADIIFYE